jgi:hypothetical protein
MQPPVSTQAIRLEARGRARAGWTAGRVASIVVGTTLALGSLAALGAGGVFAVGGVQLDLGAHGHYHTPGYALVSDSANWRSQLLGAVDSVRLRVAPEGTKPIFVGVAGPAAVRRYLHGVLYTTVHDDGNSARHDGKAPRSAPGAAVDWTARSTGTGAQTLHWNRDDGEQVLVAMNADGSASVSATVVSSTVTLRTMPALAAGLLTGGAALLGISVAFIAIAVRRGTRPAPRCRSARAPASCSTPRPGGNRRLLRMTGERGTNP